VGFVSLPAMGTALPEGAMLANPPAM
jgi:hypothetical protein